MSLPILHNPPHSAMAGDTLSWRKTLPDYPASVWTLTYTIINAASKMTVVATADGDDHLVSIPAATTAAWIAGEYGWVASVSDGTDRHTIESGRIVIKTDLVAQLAGHDARTAARKALDDLRAALATWISTKGHVQSYMVDGVNMTFASAADLKARISILEREVAREEAAERLAAGLGTGRRVMVRF